MTEDVPASSPHPPPSSRFFSSSFNLCSSSSSALLPLPQFGLRCVFKQKSLHFSFLLSFYSYGVSECVSHQGNVCFFIKNLKLWCDAVLISLAVLYKTWMWGWGISICGPHWECGLWQQCAHHPQPQREKKACMELPALAPSLGPSSASLSSARLLKDMEVWRTISSRDKYLDMGF